MHCNFPVYPRWLRSFSSSMVLSSVQAMVCVRYLVRYLLGCTDHAMVLKYEAHQGLLHYNPCNYTLGIYSDSRTASLQPAYLYPWDISRFTLGKTHTISISFLKVFVPVWMPSLHHITFTESTGIVRSRGWDPCICINYKWCSHVPLSQVCCGQR